MHTIDLLTAMLTNQNFKYLYTKCEWADLNIEWLRLSSSILVISPKNNIKMHHLCFFLCLWTISFLILVFFSFCKISLLLNAHLSKRTIECCYFVSSTITKGPIWMKFVSISGNLPYQQARFNLNTYTLTNRDSNLFCLCLCVWISECFV